MEWNINNMKAYEKGKEDFYDGKMPDDNPYDLETQDSLDWIEGYIDADVQESGETS